MRCSVPARGAPHNDRPGDTFPPPWLSRPYPLVSMSAYLELWRPSGIEPVMLEGDRVTVGAEDSNRICLADDGTVSRLHAVVENYGSGWALRDLGSRNGTYIN